MRDIVDSEDFERCGFLRFVLGMHPLYHNLYTDGIIAKPLSWGVRGSLPNRHGSCQAGRRGTSTLRRNSQTTSSRWLVPIVSTVTTPRSGLLFDSTLSSTVVWA
jgi:hypothetical protein